MKNTFVVASNRNFEVFQRSAGIGKLRIKVLVEREIGIGVEVGEGFRQGVVTLWFLTQDQVFLEQDGGKSFRVKPWKEPAKSGVFELIGLKLIPGGRWKELSEVDFTLEKLSQVDDSGAFIIGIETVGSLKSVKEFIQVFPELEFVFKRITFDYKEPVRIGLIIVPESGFMREDGGCNLIERDSVFKESSGFGQLFLVAYAQKVGVVGAKGLHRGIGILSILIFDKAAFRFQSYADCMLANAERIFTIDLRTRTSA